MVIDRITLAQFFISSYILMAAVQGFLKSRYNSGMKQNFTIGCSHVVPFFFSVKASTVALAISKG
jgi:hypothetical protein